jgi:hypothetical protein
MQKIKNWDLEKKGNSRKRLKKEWKKVLEKMEEREREGESNNEWGVFLVWENLKVSEWG